MAKHDCPADITVNKDAQSTNQRSVIGVFLRLDIMFVFDLVTVSPGDILGILVFSFSLGRERGTANILRVYPN